MNKNNLINNLYELRRAHHLSQEEFAERLNVSRQAISKWERGEAYPDTENLIAISNIFNVTLDELVHGDLSHNTDSKAEKIRAVTQTPHDPKVSVNMSTSGLHMKVRNKKENNDVSVNFSVPGVHINVDKDLYDVDINEDDDDGESDEDDVNDGEKKNRRIAVSLLTSLPYAILATAAFLAIGFLADGWDWAWTLFITIPVYDSLADAIRKRSFSEFAYPVFAAFIYCLFGMLFSWWHPGWLIFITIPIYYHIAEAIDRSIRK